VAWARAIPQVTCYIAAAARRLAVAVGRPSKHLSNSSGYFLVFRHILGIGAA